jgi:hypothetical protein
LKRKQEKGKQRLRETKQTSVSQKHRHRPKMTRPKQHKKVQEKGKKQ